MSMKKKTNVRSSWLYGIYNTRKRSFPKSNLLRSNTTQRRHCCLFLIKAGNGSTERSVLRIESPDQEGSNDCEKRDAEPHSGT